MHAWMCAHSCLSMYESVMWFLSWRSADAPVDHIIRVRNVCWPITLKGVPWLSNVSGLAFHTFSKDIFNRAQRDFYLELSSCVQQREYVNFPFSVCTYITFTRVDLRALICKWFYSPIAGQALAPYGGFMQIWDSCLIAWTMESWIKQFLNYVECWIPSAWPMSVGIIYETDVFF